MKTIGVAFIVVVVLAVAVAAQVFAATTNTLRPVSDGTNDSGSWTMGGTACSAANCFEAVDESSGGSCGGTSDGDGTYITTGTNNATQTFTVDISSIPDGSTVTAINITGCARRAGGSAAIRLRYCVNGSCVNSGTGVSLSPSYTSATRSSTGLSISKNVAATLEIGVQSASSRTVRVSALSATMTYTPPPPDTTAPAAVADLATGTAGQTSIPLSWTAPGDDDATGTASSYDIRYATEPITEANFDAATPVSGEPAPSPAGLPETTLVAGLLPETTYYFALKTADEVPNISTLSNIASTITAALPDTTAPTITGLRVESVTHNGAIIMWETDEFADSLVRYGVDPETNIDGPSGAEFVLSHAIALSGLESSTAYAYCAVSRDAANNEGSACDTFVTFEAPPPPPTGGGGGVGGARPTYASVSGFAYPGATVLVSLRPIFFGEEIQRSVTAETDGSFLASFEKFPQGIYSFNVSASDGRGGASGVKRYIFDFSSGDAPLIRESVIVPPTVRLAREVIAWGDEIRVSGSAAPNTGVLVEAGGVSYEAKSDETGEYGLTINTARFAPGKLSIRARSSVVSDFGYDYSPTRTVVMTLSSVPMADINADGVVDLVDLSKFLAKPVDMNSDGIINSTDVSVFLRAFSGIRR